MRNAARFTVGPDGVRDSFAPSEGDSTTSASPDAGTREKLVAIRDERSGTWKNVHSAADLSGALRGAHPRKVGMKISPTESIRIPRCCARCGHSVSSGTHAVPQETSWPCGKNQKRKLRIVCHYCDACWTRVKWRERVDMWLGLPFLLIGGLAGVAAGVGLLGVAGALVGFVVLWLPMFIFFACVGAGLFYFVAVMPIKALVCRSLELNTEDDIHLAQADSLSVTFVVSSVGVAQRVAEVNMQ